MEAGGFVEIGDGGNGGNVGDEMKLLRHDVVVGQGEGDDLACRVRDHPMCRFKEVLSFVMSYWPRFG